jgi:uncharacterized protein YjdB
MDFTKVPCENLETVELGKHVTSMVKGAFTEGNAVRTVISHNPVPPTADDVDIFSTKTYLEGELYVPEASIQAYQAANGWKLFGVVKAIPDSSVELVTTIQLDALEATLKEGGTLRLNAVVTPDSADNKALQWSSSDTSVATVDETGKVSAVSQGSAIITATATDGSNVTASCSIKVVKLVATIQLDITEATLNEGDALQLNAVVAPVAADNKALQWSSSNPSVATVDKNGLITAHQKGSAIITIESTDGSQISAMCIIIVLRPVTGIYMDVHELNLEVGESGSIVAYATPTDASNTTLAWSSSNDEVATVKEGVISAVSEGSAIITVQTTDGSYISKTCLVHVSNSSSIGDVATDDALISISVKHGVVYVSGKKSNDEVVVYTMSGTMLVKTKDNIIPLSQSGAFVIRVKHIAQKIVL